jgi:hypothetical protein
VGLSFKDGGDDDDNYDKLQLRLCRMERKLQASILFYSEDDRLLGC